MQYSIIAPFQSLLQLGVSRILHLQINLCKARISHNSPKMYFQNVTPHPCTLYCRYSFQKYREICTLYRESSHIMVSHRILIHPFVHCARTFCILKKLLLDILSKYKCLLKLCLPTILSIYNHSSKRWAYRIVRYSLVFVQYNKMTCPSEVVQLFCQKGDSVCLYYCCAGLRVNLIDLALTAKLWFLICGWLLYQLSILQSIFTLVIKQ